MRHATGLVRQQRFDHTPLEVGQVISAGDTLYGGPFIAHFGNTAAEWMHRLWAESHFGPYDLIVFQISPGAGRPHRVDDIFRACAVDPAKVVFLEEETWFERLHVPKQGRVLGGVTIMPGCEELFPLAPIPIQSDAAKYLYVSRSRHAFTGSYFGETLVESALEQAGFRVIRPETMSLPAVLTALRAASVIVFTEGSAIHNLELIGRVDAKVLIIGRRYGSRGRFITLLKSLVKSRDFFGDIEPVPPMARLSIPKLLDWIAGHTGLSIPVPSPEVVEQAIIAEMATFA